MNTYLLHTLGSYALLIFSFQTALLAEVSMHVEQPTEPSMYFSGDWAQAGGYMTREELSELDGYTTIREEVFPGAEMADLGVLPLKSLVGALGLGADADGLLLETTDAWESFMTIEYLEANDPMLLLYIDGKGPAEGDWPQFGGDIEPLAPYYVFVVGDTSGYPGSPQYGMISATQMTGIRAANTAARYAPFFDAPMNRLSKWARSGRDLFLQRCNVCHEGPGGIGGNVSLRPLAVLQGHANYNEDYLRKMIVNPKQFYPDTIMPNHEDFDDTKLSKIIAYLQETSELMK